MAYRLLFLLLLCIACKSHFTEESLHAQVEKIIVSDKDVVAYTINELKSDKINVFSGKEIIPFDIASLEVDIIRKHYIPNFNAFASINNNDKLILKKVNDSLHIKDLELNKSFKKNEFHATVTNPKGIDSYNYIMFFSEIKEQQLFVQLIPYNSKLDQTQRFQDVAFGSGFSFLFHLTEDHKIVNIYSERINFN